MANIWPGTHCRKLDSIPPSVCLVVANTNFFWKCRKVSHIQILLKWKSFFPWQFQMKSQQFAFLPPHFQTCASPKRGRWDFHLWVNNKIHSGRLWFWKEKGNFLLEDTNINGNWMFLLMQFIAIYNVQLKEVLSS